MNLEELKQEVENARKDYVEKFQSLFSEVTQAFFERHPDVNSISWKQYTLYFNDGDTCYFSVYDEDFEYYLEINELSFDDWANENPDIDTSYEVRSETWFAEVAQDWLKNCRLNYDEIYKEVWGDHAQVIVYRDGRVEIEEYVNHD